MKRLRRHIPVLMGFLVLSLASLSVERAFALYNVSVPIQM